MSRPLVSVILVNWNGREDTMACLESLANVAYSNFQTILVDNASTDGSPEAVHQTFPQVEIIANDRNERFARANNQGIARALEKGADYCLLLNNDTEVEPRFLDALVDRAESDPAIGMVGAKITHFDDPQRIWYAGGVVSIWRGLMAHRGLRQLDRGQFDQAEDTGYITGCCILASRKVIEKIGDLDENYYIYAEDADWCYRARLAGFRLVYEPSAKILHKVSSSSGGKAVAGGLTPFKVTHKIRSTLRFYTRYARWYHWLTISLFALWYFFKAAVLMLRSGNIAALAAMLKSLRPDQSNDQSNGQSNKGA